MGCFGYITKAMGASCECDTFDGEDITEIARFRANFVMWPRLQEAMDAWSLRVMAFELLTGTTALPMHEGQELVRPAADELYITHSSLSCLQARLLA